MEFYDFQYFIISNFSLSLRYLKFLIRIKCPLKTHPRIKLFLTLPKAFDLISCFKTIKLLFAAYRTTFCAEKIEPACQDKSSYRKNQRKVKQQIHLAVVIIVVLTSAKAMGLIIF